MAPGPQWSNSGSEVSATYQALKALTAQLVSVAGPASQAGFSLARANSGVSDHAVTRKVEYQTQRLSVADRASNYGYANTVPSPPEIIRQLHRRGLVDLGGAVGLSPDAWIWAKDRLAASGIDLALPGEAGAPTQAKDWLEIVRMSATAAPIGDALRAYYRLRPQGNAESARAEQELDFHFRRAGMSRTADRELVTSPYVNWSTSDAERLAWLGMIDEVTRIALYNAAGCVNPTDQQFSRWLHARIPGAETMIGWGVKRLWDNDIAARYGLDDAYNNSPAAIYWAKAQGLGVLPGEPDDQPQPDLDFLKLTFRDQMVMPSFGAASEMQHRLRDNPAAPGMSVIAGVPSWTAEDTRNALRREGYSEVLIERMMGLVDVPLSVRILNTTLTEALAHPNVAAAAQAAFGENVDWVKSVYLDHGFSDAVSTMAAAAKRAQAEDQYNSEKLATLKAQRKERRDLAKRRYLLGVITDEQYALDSQDEFYDTPMVRTDLELMTLEWHTKIVETQIEEIRRAFKSGKINADQAQAQLAGGGINQNRMVLYIQEWVWEKNEAGRVLQTGEILRMVKEGLMPDGVALARLVNLGWSAPEAILELAMVEHDMQQAAARKQETIAARQQSELRRQQREQAAEAKRLATEKTKAAKDARKTAFETATAPLEQAALAGTYTAQSHADLAAYAKADAKNNEEKKAEIVAKAAAQYATWLADQLKLRERSIEVEHEVGPIDTTRIDVPPPSKEDSGDTGEPAQPSDEPTEGSGGPDATANP